MYLIRWEAEVIYATAPSLAIISLSMSHVISSMLSIVAIDNAGCFRISAQRFIERVRTPLVQLRDSWPSIVTHEMAHR
jgi:hypothetical protein